MRLGVRGGVPEGLDEGSQAIYCLEEVLSRFRPVLSAIARMATEEGHGLILTPGLTNRPGHCTPIGPNHTVSAGQVPFLHVFQAINCLATIIQSLRDNKPPLPVHILTPHHSARPYSNSRTRTTTRTATRLSSPKSCPTKPVVCRLQAPMTWRKAGERSP